MPRKPKTPAKGKAKGSLPRAKRPTDPAVKAAADRAEARAKGKKPKAEKPTSPIDPVIKTAEEMVAKSKGGRPTLYNEEIAAEILTHIINGKSLSAWCKVAGRPKPGTVYNWIARHAEFREQYARAREEQADTYADEIVEISDTEEDPQRARVRIDARKWVAAKLKPKVYSDYTRVDQSVTLTQDQVDARLDQLMAKAAGVPDVVHH